MAPCRGVASCLYCKVSIDAGILGQVNQSSVDQYAPSLTGLQHRAEGLPQAAIPRPKRRVKREEPCAGPKDEVVWSQFLDPISTRRARS